MMLFELVERVNLSFNVGKWGAVPKMEVHSGPNQPTICQKGCWCERIG